MGNSLNVLECDSLVAFTIEQHVLHLGYNTNKFNHLTVEELFYVEKILRWNPAKANPHGNQFMITIKAAVLRWLEDHRPKPFVPWEKLAFYWQKDFFRFMETGE